MNLRPRPGFITILVRSQIVNHGSYAGTEFRLTAEQAYNQPARLGHPEKVARLHPYSTLQQGEYSLFVWLDRWNSKRSVPAPFQL